MQNESSQNKPIEKQLTKSHELNLHNSWFGATDYDYKEKRNPWIVVDN